MAKQDEIQNFFGYYSKSGNLIGCSKTDQSNSPMFKHAETVDNILVVKPERYENDIKAAKIKGGAKAVVGTICIGLTIQGGIRAYRWIKKKIQERKERKQA
jgi:hypothetical protein